MKNIYDEIVSKVPSLQKGMVWCHSCGKSQKVDSAKCLASGWPKHCGSTMSLDKPRGR